MHIVICISCFTTDLSVIVSRNSILNSLVYFIMFCILYVILYIGKRLINYIFISNADLEILNLYRYLH